MAWQLTTINPLENSINSVISTTYPDQIYHQLWSDSQARQQLIEYVACRLQQVCPALKVPGNWSLLPKYLKQSIDLRLRLESYIYWGLEFILNNQGLSRAGDTTAPQSRPAAPCECLPSHWFG